MWTMKGSLRMVWLRWFVWFITLNRFPHATRTNNPSLYNNNHRSGFPFRFPVPQLCSHCSIKTHIPASFALPHSLYSGVDAVVSGRTPRHVSSLRQGQWVKIINGAANQDLPLIRNLCYLYTLANVDCFDLSPDLSVLLAAQSGIHSAMKDLSKQGIRREKPLVMISITDSEDLHFRKAFFDPRLCPTDCPRPCERVCPASAIPSLSAITTMDRAKGIREGEGVITSKCYGCGRCVDVCPRGLILTRQFTFSLDDVESLLRGTRGEGDIETVKEIATETEIERLVDAIEIHTSAMNNGFQSFENLWTRLGESILRNVQVLSISLQDGPITKQKSKQTKEKAISEVDEETETTMDTMTFIKELYHLITKHDYWSKYQGVLLWQADGRPMSGDIGKGSTHATIQFAGKLLQEAETLFNNEIDSVLSENEASVVPSIAKGKVFIQLAGGANQYTVPLAKEEVISEQNQAYFGGAAFGGYARKTISQWTKHLSSTNASFHIEDYPEELTRCLEFVENLVQTVKPQQI